MLKNLNFSSNTREDISKDANERKQIQAINKWFYSMKIAKTSKNAGFFDTKSIKKWRFDKRIKIFIERELSLIKFLYKVVFYF